MPSEPSPKTPEDLRRFAHDLRNLLSALYTYQQVLELSLRDKHMEKEIEISQAMTESIQKIESLLTREMDGPSR